MRRRFSRSATRCTQVENVSALTDGARCGRALHSERAALVRPVAFERAVSALIQEEIHVKSTASFSLPAVSRPLLGFIFSSANLLPFLCLSAAPPSDLRHDPAMWLARQRGKARRYHYLTSCPTGCSSGCRCPSPARTPPSGRRPAPASSARRPCRPRPSSAASPAAASASSGRGAALSPRRR